MARVVNPLPGGGAASRRSLSGDDSTAATTKPHLTVVRSSAHRPFPHRGMWQDDPIADPTVYTRVEDWPAAADFEPLISAAREAGDSILVAQLEADAAFCAQARKRLESERQDRKPSSA